MTEDTPDANDAAAPQAAHEPGARDLTAARFGRAVSAALRRRRPETGRTRWYTRVADACECDETSVQNWVGGLAPSAVFYWLLVDHFGPALHREVSEAMTGRPLAPPKDFGPGRHEVADHLSNADLAAILASRLGEGAP